METSIERNETCTKELKSASQMLIWVDEEAVDVDTIEGKVSNLKNQE